MFLPCFYVSVLYSRLYANNCGHFKIQEITRWFKNKTLERSSETHPDDKLSQAKASQPEVENTII